MSPNSNPQSYFNKASGDGSSSNTSTTALNRYAIEISVWRQDPVLYIDNLVVSRSLSCAESCDAQGLTSLYKKHWSEIRNKFQMKGKQTVVII